MLPGIGLVAGPALTHITVQTYKLKTKSLEFYRLECDTDPESFPQKLYE